MLYSQLWHMRIHAHTIAQEKKNGIVIPQHEFDALFQGVQYRKIITRFQQFYYNGLQKGLCCARSQNSRVRFGKAASPLPHSTPFFFNNFFFGARLEDKWCRARAPRTKVGPTFGEEHRGRYNPRNTEKVHIIYTTPSMNNANRPARKMVKCPHHRTIICINR